MEEEEEEKKEKERKMATIRKITDIQPIPNADNIEIATVDGWKVIVKKGEFVINDLAIYCEIDSFLPIIPEFEFLRKQCFAVNEKLEEGFKLKTIKLRGQISQGLLIKRELLGMGNYGEGRDVSEELNIIKYEPPVPASLNGQIKGNFPSFLRKTGVERIQNLKARYPEFVELSKKAYYQFYATEKLDGTSVTYYIKDGVFGVCSRNYELKEEQPNVPWQEITCVYWRMARKYNVEEKLRRLGANVCVQGEIIGESIQGNNYRIKGNEVYFFSIFYIDDQKYGSFDDLKILPGQIGLPLVPYRFIKFPNDFKEFLEQAEFNSAIGTASVLAEGLVVHHMNDKSIRFKVISDKYLLRNSKKD
jgi:RNA ligase (TIGR02306 family)